MNILVSGIKSGLGKYLHENLGGAGFDKDDFNAKFPKLKLRSFDTIIHCAFNPARLVDSSKLGEYIFDNLLLTEKLLSLKHKKFIYISSVDVYPKDSSTHREDEIIDLNRLKSIYSITKLSSEAIVSRLSKNHLILRMAALLGKYSRENNVIKMIKSSGAASLSLSPESSFSFVLYSDLLDFIRLANKSNLRGIYNIASKGRITVSSIARSLDYKPKFGKFLYKTPKVSTKKTERVFKGFNKSQLAIINQFAMELRNG